MTARGEDHGSFLIPAHACLRMHLDGDRLELTPLPLFGAPTVSTRVKK